MSEVLAKYEVTGAEGRMLINLLGIEPRIDRTEIPTWYKTKKPNGYVFAGKIFDRDGGSFHIRIGRENPRKGRYSFIVDHYDPPCHYSIVPSVDTPNNGSLKKMKERIEERLSAIRDKNSDIINTKIVKRQ